MGPSKARSSRHTVAELAAVAVTLICAVTACNGAVVGTVVKATYDPPGVTSAAVVNTSALDAFNQRMTGATVALPD